jgi:ADP-ribosylglycohydrolase
MNVIGFEETLDANAQTGGDADTIGSIAGQVAGSHLGRSGLPARLVALAPVQEIAPVAEAFARFALKPRRVDL